MGSLLERIGVELPVVQAGMGGGTAGHELAAAVSEAGGLGTIGILDPPGTQVAENLRRELGVDDPHGVRSPGCGSGAGASARIPVPR